MFLELTLSDILPLAMRTTLGILKFSRLKWEETMTRIIKIKRLRGHWKCYIIAIYNMIWCRPKPQGTHRKPHSRKLGAIFKTMWALNSSHLLSCLLPAEPKEILISVTTDFTLQSPWYVLSQSESETHSSCNTEIIPKSNGHLSADPSKEYK